MDQLPKWLEELEAAVTVADEAGRILAMNQRAAETFASSGGRALVGSNFLDCHLELARSKLAALLGTVHPNHYT